MSDTSNPVLANLHRLGNKFDDIGDAIQDFMARQAAGEKPDPDEFSRLMELQSVDKSAMQAQFNLLQKPLKTVLNEVKQ